MSYQNLKLTIFRATLLGALLVSSPSYALKEADSPIKNADITAEMTALKINGIFESSQADAFNDIRDILKTDDKKVVRTDAAQKAELKVLIKDLKDAWIGNIKPTDFVKLRKGGVSIKDWLEIVALGKDQKDREYAFPDTVMDDVIAYKKLGNDMKDIKKFYAAYGKNKSYATIEEAMNDPETPSLKTR